ncbi:hypothetical protein JKF63_06130 [Porcisia hertigi]|uniref:Uncharacterized protein n=1 Tax=Porcisia hertigi TaxID=2761500 RepID=A0A836LEC4_9TRYP|nr:hypothetical protein JKF63_06130 [Porcisia hertigi]
MLFVPLDTYHFLLTYHDVDLAGQLDRNCDKHTAVTVAERLSADSPGRRPPRSGICVVRRLEGELRGVDTASSFTTAAPVSTPCPTLSHVVHGLPLDAFDGWVRDYTVYGLRCNEAVLRAAWEDKTCERGWGASPVPMGAMMETEQSAASARKAVSSDSLCDNPDDVDLAVLHESCSEDAAVDGAAAAEGAGAAKETRARSGEEAVTRASGDAEPAAMVSPSLDRLNCSSTTSSGITAFTPSASIERSGNKNSLGGVEVTTEVAERESGGVPDTISVSQMSTRSQMQQKNVLWDEERAPAERAAEQLRHRFLVSDSAQHAIWALEVCLPAMEVRALSPAEFYASEIEDGHARGEPEAPIQGENGEEGAMDAPPLELALPRKRSAVTAAQGGIMPSSHRGSATGSYRVHASRLRSPSPTNPSTPSATGDADDRGNSPHAGGDERRCTTSVRTQSTAVSCSSTQHLGRPASSASRSLAMAEATTTPLIGGGRGFVDGHFSLARFCSPGALCWRIDEEEEDDDDEKGHTHHGMVVESEEIHGRRARLSVQHRRDDPIADAARRRHCTVLFISDMGNCAIRYADFGNRLVRTITGVNGVPGYRDGSCMSSMLRGATALAWCSAGLIFTDGANNVVRLITDIGGRRKSREKRDSGEDTPETAADDSSACCATRATASKRRSSRESEVLQESATTTEEPPCVEEKPVDEERRAHPFIAEESQNGALQGMPPPSAWKRKSPAVVVPRVWTLAGCTSKTSIDQSTGGVDANVASYVDCAVPSRARFGYISDMALWTDETGDTQVLLVDQTHHALRILDAHRGVSTYVGPLDYEAMSTVSPSTASTSAANSLPPGLVFPCCLTVGALIKERSPALLSATATATAATMITPQPYLYSSSPLLFTASAVTSAVSMLLPISRCSAPTSCNLHENQSRSTSTEAREAEAMCLSNVDNATKFDAIRGALELGVATEGRRVIGEAATPSLKHLVVCWGEDEATDDEAESSHAAPRRSSVASGQQALQYLRMRFPWLLPPSVPLLSSRLVAACTCHVSGKRRGTTAPTAGSKALGVHSQTGSNSHSAHIQEGAHPDGVDGIRRGVTTTGRPLPQQQRLLFQDPTRHSPMATCRYTSATAPAAAAAKEVVTASLNTHSRDVGGDGAAPVDRPEVGGGRSSSSSSKRSNPYRASSPLSPNDNLKTVEGEEGEQVTPGGDVGGGRRPVAKWLPPPLKSVSRSPSNTRGQQQQQQEEKSHADLAGSPSNGTAATYAGQFQEWSSEQRQKRLRSTLENSDSTSMLDTSPGGTPPVLDGRRQQMEGDGRHGFSPRGPQSAKCGSLEQTDLLLTPSSARSPRAHPTSSNKLSSRGSPPLTPRAMVAHQLMQRRRSSRSNTAPHVRSVEREASGSTSGPRTAVVDAHGVCPPPPQTKRKDGSVVGAASAEPPRVPAVPDRRTVQPCRADAHLHDVYDMAVRQLFRIYDYLAKKVVTTKAAASRNCNNEGSPWATHQPHQVVQYSMSFAAFLRFFVLTGYGDYLSEVAAAAVDAHGKDDVDPRAAARVHSAPSPMSMLCRLTQVQPGGGGGDNAPQWRSACRKPGIAHPKPSLPPNVMVVPLATTDLRAIAAALYACGVRQKGYHTVTQMDFQSFRRVALLLYTWARTARCAETAKRANTTDDVAVECGRGSGHRKTGGQNSAGGGSRRCPTRGGTTVAAFAYVDAVPSLDALSSSEVVAAYTEVYERAVRCIPALAMSYGREATNKGDEDDDGEARAVDRAKERSDEIQHDRQVNAMCAADSVAAPPSEVGAGSRGVDRELVDLDEAATPPLSPIAATAVAGDVSCLAIDGNAVVKSRKYAVMETPSTLGNADDATNLFPTGRLTPCETLALDALLRLLQSNEATFAQLFEAYSVPITVHRSPQYESPSSAAAAASASASNTCSVLMCSPEASLVLRDGREAAVRRQRRASATFVAPTASGTSSVPVAPPVIAHRDHRTGASAHGMPSTMPGLAKTVAGVDVEHGSAALSGISTTQQDVSWKVRQLCTMSAAESKDIYERTSHVLRVVTFKLFVELWRTLDVFPSLMRKGAMEQAFYDALTTPMLRGSKPPQPGCTSGAPMPQGQLQPPLNRPGALAHRHVIELLCAHGGLPYACFVESFVRVALTVFSHEVDRIAYPTATAKTAGLMQWCNKQVTLGLVAKRVQQQHSAVATGRHDSNKRSSSMISMDATPGLFSATPATRTARVAGAFPNQLRLFRLPPAAKTR